MSARVWFRDREARRLIARGYLPWLGVLMLAWEIAHSPLYTLWREAKPGYVAFAILHCTLGDILIGGFSLALALSALRQGELASWRWRTLAAATAALAAGYTLFSEWMNVAVLRSWGYAESMPMLSLGEAQIALTPLLQWLLVPPAALYLARKARRARDA